MGIGNLGGRVQRRSVSHPGSGPNDRPYSPGLVVGPIVMISGQFGVDPRTSRVVGTDTDSQTRQALQNIRSLLEQAGMRLDHVVKTTVFLRSMDDFAAMNKAYGEFFPEPQPARSTLAGVDLSRAECLIEVEAMAMDFDGWIRLVE